MPSHQDLEKWLEEHKDEFIQARTQQTRREPSPARHIQEAPQVVGPTAAEPNVPAAHNPDARPPPNRPASPIANVGIFRSLARYASRTIYGFGNRPDPTPEEAVPQELPLILHVSQGNLEQHEQPGHTTNIDHLNLARTMGQLVGARRALPTLSQHKVSRITSLIWRRDPQYGLRSRIRG